jgi:hypothetical protein
MGLAKATRELVGEDGLPLVRFWLGILEDEGARARTAVREASRLLADQGWGKAPAFAPVEAEDPLGLEEARGFPVPGEARRLPRPRLARGSPPSR